MSLYSKSEIESSFNRVISFLLSFLSKNKVLFIEKDKLLLKSKLQAILKTKFQDELDQILLNLVLENSYKAESISAGGFLNTLKNLSLEKSDQISSFHPTKEEIYTIINNHLDNHKSEILMNALELAGFAGKISIEKSKNENFSLELIDSYNFYAEALGEKSAKLIRPKVIIIDGFVESVSEINVLLESLIDSGNQLILITRGFHPEVINTVNVNNNRKVISAYLFQVPFDIDGLNTLVDISVTCGTQPLSSNLGQIISNVSIKDAVTVDEISFSNNKISIKNKKVKNNVQVHLHDLLKRSKEKSEISEIYEKRINCLKGSNVTIRIPDDVNFVENSNNIDACLRSIQSLISYGISENFELTGSQIVGSLYSRKIKELVKDLGGVLIC